LASHLIEVMSDGIGIAQPFMLLEFAARTVKSVLVLLSAIGRISVATRWFLQVSAGQVPDGEVASGDKATSGNKVGPVYLYRHPSSQVDGRQVHRSHRFGQILIASPACDYLNTGKV